MNEIFTNWVQTKVTPTALHYENTSMQYTAIFHSCKNDNFQMKNCDIFLIFAQNIDRGTHDLCFRAKIRKKIYTPVNPSFTI